MANLTLLQVPWGLMGAARRQRQRLEPGCVVETEDALSPLLHCDDQSDILLNGRDDALEPLFSPADAADGQGCLFELPIPRDADELQRLRLRTWQRDIAFRWTRSVSRPIDESHRSAPGSPAFLFTLPLRARLNDVEMAQSRGVVPWAYLAEAWQGPEDGAEPAMDLLVEHARRYRALWKDIAANPRRLLAQERELMPLSRVQTLDTQCMQWLSRQPGGSLAERAGGRQRILALSRQQDSDTLENRVFLDLLERSVTAAGDYLARSRQSRGRYEQVLAYQRECRRLALGLKAQGIAGVPDVVTPNHVLLHDGRYRSVWTAWRDIVRRQKVKDDLWRWQRRSWAEFCRICVSLALIGLEDARLIAASPLLTGTEHHRGQWLLHDDPLTVIGFESKKLVIEVLGTNCRDVTGSLRRLGATAWLRLSTHDGGVRACLPVWTLHDVRQAELSELVASASTALQAPELDLPVRKGLLLQSLLDQEAGISLARSGDVVGLAFGPRQTQLVPALKRLGSVLADIAGSVS